MFLIIKMEKEEIGTGSVSKVYAENGVAVKVYNDMSTHEDDFETEVACLIELKGCKWVVQYISHDTQMGSITMELLEGDIVDLLLKRELFPHTWIENFTVDVLKADYAMGIRDIFHADINFKNVLYYINDDEEIHFKVCDFSHSTIMENESGITKPYPILGAPEWYKVNYEILNYAKSVTWTIAGLIYFIQTRKFITHELWKTSSYYKPGLKFHSTEHLESIEKFIIDNVDGEFSQTDIEDCIEYLDMDDVKNSDKLKEFLFKALVIDNTDRITSAEALGIFL